MVSTTLPLTQTKVPPAAVCAITASMAEEFSLRNNLQPEIAAFLESVGKVSVEPAVRVFLVGGLVRDVLLGVDSPDIDLLIEGDGIAFAKFLRDNWGELFPELPAPQRCVSFKRYRTAKLLFEQEVLPGVRELDFASTRGERYPTPGGAPEVWPAKLEEDLSRRDFSINAIAVGLSAGEFGKIFDLFEGFEHLGKKQLVVLHDKSFVDDPVRVIRGGRFVARFGFSFDEKTLSLVEDALNQDLLNTVPPRRLFDELRKALCDEPVVPVLEKLQALGVLQRLIPEGGGSIRAFNLLNQLGSDGAAARLFKSEEHWLVYLACLCVDLNPGDLRAWIERVELGSENAGSVLRVHSQLAGMEPG